MKEKKQQLHEKLWRGILEIMEQDSLYPESQLVVLTYVYCEVVRYTGALMGHDGDQMLKDLIEMEMNPIVFSSEYHPSGESVGIPFSAFKAYFDKEREKKSHDNKPRGGRVVQPDEANSWLRVFPSPLSVEQVLRNVLHRSADGSLGYNPADVATKMQGVLLTSMPEEDKAEIKRRMKALHLLVVSKPDHSRLCYVVFGAGMQASTKTEVVRDRIAHQEIIEGVYFEDWLEVLDELEEMKEGYDMDYIAQCEALAEEEAEAQGDGSSSSPTASTADDADDLPF